MLEALGQNIGYIEMAQKIKMLEAPGQNIGYIEMAQKIKVRKTGVWVDKRSQKNVADYNAKMNQKHGENWRETHHDDKDVWLDCCGGNSHGHIYMIGSTIRSSNLKNSHASQSGQSNTPLAPGSLWVTQDEFDAIREELIKQNEEQKQHDWEEIQKLRKQQEDPREMSHLVEEQLREKLSKQEKDHNQQMQEIQHRMLPFEKLVSRNMSFAPLPSETRPSLVPYGSQNRTLLLSFSYKSRFC